MADKRTIKQNIKRLQRVRTWQLLLVLIVALLVAATFLRLNNIGMVERRKAVVAADKSGTQEDIQNRLYDLQRYVSAHMNADTGKIALQEQYARDSERIKRAAEAEASSNPNGNVYQKAAEVCDPIGRAQGWRWPDPRYISCIDTELSKYPASSGGAAKVQLPDINQYYHSFVSPIWSPDFAGFSVLVCIVLAAIIAFRWISLAVLKVLVKRHYRSI